MNKCYCWVTHFPKSPLQKQKQRQEIDSIELEGRLVDKNLELGQPKNEANSYLPSIWSQN